MNTPSTLITTRKIDPTTTPESFKPHHSTAITLQEIEAALDEKFPVTIDDDATLDRLINHYKLDSAPEHRAQVRAQLLQGNRELRQAFEEYRQAACQPNPIYQYIVKHLREGFSPDEFLGFTDLLMERGGPTTYHLAGGDMVLRAAGIHTDLLAANLAEETRGTSGKARNAHMDLLIQQNQGLQTIPHRAGERSSDTRGDTTDFLDDVLMLLLAPSESEAGDMQTVNNISTHAMIEQLARFARAGLIHIPPEESLQNERLKGSFIDPSKPFPLMNPSKFFASPETIEALYQQFESLCAKEGLILPHHVRDAWGEHYYRNKAGDLIPLPADVQVPIQSTHSKRFPQQTDRQLLAPTVNRINFYTALLAVAKGPEHHERLAYGEGIRRSFYHPTPDNPQHMEFILRSVLDVLTREGNAAGPEQVTAALRIVHAYKSLVAEAAGKSKKDQERAMQKFITWADIHVSESIGIEEDHADQARELFMTLFHAASREGSYCAPQLTKAFHAAAREGYLATHYQLMGSFTKSMEKVRSKSPHYTLITPLEQPRRWTEQYDINPLALMTNVAALAVILPYVAATNAPLIWELGKEYWTEKKTRAAQERLPRT